MEEFSYKTDKLILENIETYLKRHEQKSLLRFITCGSVDDGKSTLIGRLLYDSKVIFEDQLNQLRVDSAKSGTQGKEIDFALLVDGLEAEREQGITIDVAYRFFSTENRKFIVADTPGHEQFTRNMVTAASTADLAIILVDARKGVLTQTRRHSFICKMLGIKDFLVAVNKMDLVGYDQQCFRKIVDEYETFCNSIGVRNFSSIPLSGLNGDNIVVSSTNTPWYEGSTLMSYLEEIKLEKEVEVTEDFSMPVQWVNRPNINFRGFSGKIAAGTIRPGDPVRIIPSGKRSQIDKIVTFDGDLAVAQRGDSVTLTLRDEIDCSRGQIITSDNAPLEVADQFETTLIWMAEQEMVPGRSYQMKIGSMKLNATIAEPKYKINMNTLEHVATKKLDLNAVGVANITTDRLIPFKSFKEDKNLGGFILIDKISNSTIAAGLINFSLMRAQNVHWHPPHIDRNHHAKVKNQKPLVIWMTGLSGSGKSTIANELEKKLAYFDYHSFLLDGDNIRHGLNKDLGYTDADRIENMRRIGEVAKLMADAGLIVIVAFISPFRQEREMVKGIMQSDEFIEVFVDTPLAIAEQRDVKGLYKKARSGLLKNFTGIDSVYEAPENPDIYIDTTKLNAEEAAQSIFDYISKR